MILSCMLLYAIYGCFYVLSSADGDANYVVGVGSYDMTGPAADVNMMGYANMEQNTAGIHFRLRARTFIVAEPEEYGKRLVFVNLDAGMASQLVTIKVLERLKTRYGDLYNENNVAISGIHTHSGPGGYLQYLVYVVTALGFVQQSFDAIVDAIEKSIVQAHQNLRPGSIFVNKGELVNAGINRSPSAYLNNPVEERAKYKHNVDTEMTLLKLVDAQMGPVGAFSWFPTHGTSMSRDNKLISGDNKGAAARFMEDWYSQQTMDASSSSAHSTNKFAQRSSPSGSIYSKRNMTNIEALAAKLSKTGGRPCKRKSSVEHRVRSSNKMPTLVAAFCQSNVGDVSPNVLGAFCLDTGLPCDFNHSSCNGNNQLCIGRGPGYPSDFSSTQIIGNRQFKKAVDLFNSAKEQLSGKIDYRHVYLDFTKLKVKLPDQKQEVKTCPAALGPGFAAGTTDGPGAFGFQQGDTEINPFWKLVRDLLKKPTQEQIDCHKPKTVLLDTGEMFEPYAWAPAILPIQVLKIGQFIILCVPGVPGAYLSSHARTWEPNKLGYLRPSKSPTNNETSLSEFTTMAGRRLREAIKETLIASGNGEYSDDTYVVIAGLTNTYSQYVATFEEYQEQRYEGASTLYGPHTLSAYIQEFKELAKAMALGEEMPDKGPSPPDLSSKQFSLLLPVLVDITPPGVSFGDVKKDVANASYKIGDIVSASFWSANPRNDLQTEGTFSLVEHFDDANEKWYPEYDDDDFGVLFKWNKTDDTNYGYATIEWLVPRTVIPGIYRIRHFGAAKQFASPNQYFTGTSSTFVVS
eukprot:Gb_04896 [translate_table: standard]